MLGKVKSRLAKSIGEENALSVYKKLLLRTKEMVTFLDIEKVVYYSDHIEHDDTWDNDIFKKDLQRGADLGERMYNSIDAASRNSFGKICLIGSDNMEISHDIINRAYDCLDTHDIVFGPSKDGGYYLIGMKAPIKDIFKEINWSTSSVLDESIKKAKMKELGYVLLPELNDIDELEDIREEDRDFLLS